MLRLLLDTSVWLDVAKDWRQQPVLGALRELVREGEIMLVVPDVVRDEFARNKDRVAADARRSLQSHFRQVCEAVNRFGDDGTKLDTLSRLHEVDHRIVINNEAVYDSIWQIDVLLAGGHRMRTTKAIKQRVTERALAGLAPYHRSRNSVGDAVIVECYAAMAKAAADDGNPCAFATHNVKDFSDESGDRREPHPDLAAMFDSEASTFWVSLVDVLRHVDPDLLDDQDAEFNWTQEPRKLSEILEAAHLLDRQVWYNRHWNLRWEIQEGKVKVTPKSEYSTQPYRQDQILDTVWAGALKAAKRTEQEIGKENLGPWTDFEWGMVNGKLSAIRWVLGEDWDELYT
ncbi:PIN domain-containing protein [Mesorhizobium calcicola]|uniref:PIN domain-containing protein n=1 Tax=Mesorhizobium calcicola TaxID=1300310 RepID=A0ABW4WFL9_9HYPH